MWYLIFGSLGRFDEWNDLDRVFDIAPQSEQPVYDTLAGVFSASVALGSSSA